MRTSYANQDFDIQSYVASRLTDDDRAEGRPAPAFGNSASNIVIARASWRRLPPGPPDYAAALQDARALAAKIREDQPAY